MKISHPPMPPQSFAMIQAIFAVCLSLISTKASANISTSTASQKPNQCSNRVWVCRKHQRRADLTAQAILQKNLKNITLFHRRCSEIVKQMRQYPNSPELSKIAVYRRCRSWNPSGFLQPSASVTNNFISIQVQRIFGVGFLRQWEAKYPIILTYLRIF